MLAMVNVESEMNQRAKPCQSLCIAIVLLFNFFVFFSFYFVLISSHICMTGCGLVYIIMAKHRWSLPQRNVTKHEDPRGLVVLSEINLIYLARDPQTEA